MDTVSQNNSIIKCEKHPTFTCLYININKGFSDNTLFCAECLEEKNDPNIFKSLISLESILQSDQTTIFNKWPYIENEDLLKAFKKNVQYERKIEELSQTIKEIKTNFSTILDSIQKSYLQIFDMLQTAQEEGQALYNKISDKQTMKDIISSGQSYKKITDTLDEYLYEMRNRKYSTTRFIQEKNDQINKFVDEVEAKKKTLMGLNYQLNDYLENQRDDPYIKFTLLSLQDTNQHFNSQIFSTFIFKYVMKNYSQIFIKYDINDKDVVPFTNELSKLVDIHVKSIPINKSKEYNMMKDTKVVKLQYLTSDTYLDVSHGEQEIRVKKRTTEKVDSIGVIERPFCPRDKFIIRLELGADSELQILNQVFFGFTQPHSLGFLSQSKFGFLFKGATINNSLQGQLHMKKGSLIKLHRECTNFEIRLSQSEGILEISDYPLYENIVSLDPALKETLKSSEKLMFGIEIFTQDNYAIIKEIKKVESFPDYSQPENQRFQQN